MQGIGKIMDIAGAPKKRDFDDVDKSTARDVLT